MAERVSGPRGERYRHLFARLSLVRAPRSERSASCWRGGRWPAPRPPGSSSRSSSRRSPAPTRPGPGPARPRGRRWALSGIARGRLGPAVACALRPTCVLPRFSPGVIPGSSCLLGAHSLAHTEQHADPFLRLRGSEDPARRGDPPGPAQALPLTPPAGRVVESGMGWGAPATGWGEIRLGSRVEAAGRGLGAGFPGFPRGD